MCKSFWKILSTLHSVNSFTTIQNPCQINVVNNFDLPKMMLKMKRLPERLFNFQIDKNSSLFEIFIDQKFQLIF